MCTKLRFTFLLAILLSLFSVTVVGQQTPTDQELDEQIKVQNQRNEKLRQLVEAKDEERRLLERLNTSGKQQTESPTPPSGERPRTSNPENGRVTQPQTAPPTTGTDNSRTGTGNTGSTSQPDPQNPTGGNNSPQIDCSLQNLSEFDGTRVNEAVCRIIQRINSQNIDGRPLNELSVRNTQEQILNVLAAKLADNSLAKSFFLESERQRTDKQVGSTPEQAGTTSLVVKGGTPALIGWAIEQGAATSSISGNTVTIRVNPFNLTKALYYRQGIIPLVDVDEKQNEFRSFLKKLSIGVSFDTTRGTETPAFTGNRQQISAFSVRYEFINHRNPLAPRHRDLRNGFFNAQTANFDKITEAIRLFRDRNTGRFFIPKLNEWLDETNVELSKIPETVIGNARLDRITAIIESQIGKLPIEELAKEEKLKDIIKLYTQGAMAFKEARDELLAELSDGQIMTFEYTNNREQIKPDTSNFRFIWEKGFFTNQKGLFANTDLTFNASLTMYNRKPSVPGVRRIRDFQFALQSDTKMGDPFNSGDFLLSFAGKYERLNTDTFDEMGIVKPGSKGDIAFGQIKLTIPIADLGIRLPFSITFANRSELIKESHVRANFGFTFDLDPLFARGKLF